MPQGAGKSERDLIHGGLCMLGSGHRLMPFSLAPHLGRLVLDKGTVGNREFTAHIEKIVLDIEQQRVHVGAQLLGQQQAKVAVELIDFANGVHARADFSDPRAVTKASGAGVAGAGVDLRKAVSHDMAL